MGITLREMNASTNEVSEKLIGSETKNEHSSTKSVTIQGSLNSIGGINQSLSSVQIRSKLLLQSNDNRNRKFRKQYISKKNDPYSINSTAADEVMSSDMLRDAKQRSHGDEQDEDSEKVTRFKKKLNVYFTNPAPETPPDTDTCTEATESDANNQSLNDDMVSGYYFEKEKEKEKMFLNESLSV